MNTKEQIIDKLKTNYSGKNMGQLLNFLQDVAEKAISTKSFNSYLKKANEDQELCDGQDCIVINGEVFDWKEFEYKKYEIAESFLDYFSESSLQKILNVL